MSKQQDAIIVNKFFLNSFIRLFKLYWLSKEKKRSIFLVLIATTLTFTSVRGSVLMNDGNKMFFDALQQFDMRQVLHSFIPFSLGIFIWIGSESIAFYCNGLLSARWRLWLTRYNLAHWFRNHTHYHMHLKGQVDNPDQRVSEDLESFPILTIGLFFILLHVVLIIGSYGYILWGTSSRLIIPIAGKTLIFMVIYFGVLLFMAH